MVLAQKISPLVRAVAVIGSVAALVSGVTFAALQSQATLTDNTISSATAGLVVNNQVGNDTTFSPAEPGFAFTNLIPGTASDAKPFQLRNSGTVPLDVYVELNNEEVLPAGVTGDEISFTFTPLAVGGTTVTKTWTELTTAPQSLLPNFANNVNASADYTVSVTIAPTVTASSINITAFDFVFSGATVGSTPTPAVPTT
jgi:hypothetical protein